jgi:crotonobetaine/carnitine-CoA ligase
MPSSAPDTPKFEYPAPATSTAAPDPSLRQLVERQAARLGRRHFVTLPDGTLSFAELDELANRMAWVLASLGVGPGDVVMARCGNNRAMVGTWLGCAKLNSVYMPLNSLLSGEPLRSVMGLVPAAVIVCDPELYPALAASGAVLPPVLLGGRTLDALLEGASSSPPPPLDADPSAPAKLMCTSGTTGTPKGVVWSRACEATWAAAYGDELLPIQEGEGLYSCLPLFHITCQGTLLAALRRGGRMTVEERFDPFGFWSRVRRSEAVGLSFVGTLLSVLAKRPRQPDDADNPLRWILGSAAPVGSWAELEERFGVSIIETWGQTETASCWTAPATLPQRPGTVGRPSARFEARIAPTGELHIRPLRPHVMFDGYLEGSDPESGKLVLSREGWTEEGFYRTGDLMVRHPDGDLSFRGRLRESIRRRGEIIPANLIEAAALEHHSVLEAAAVGVPDDDGVEQEVMLCVVVRRDGASELSPAEHTAGGAELSPAEHPAEHTAGGAELSPAEHLAEHTAGGAELSPAEHAAEHTAGGADLSPAELHAFLRLRLPKFMVPRYVDLRGELPKTPTTRVRKLALSEEGAATAWDSRHRDR